jgi:hypothetical protein
MSTGRKLVSDVRAMHKLLSSDGLLTDRAILSEIRANSALIIKRETNLRKLWATDTLFTTIPCLELIEVPISECCGYTDPCSVARTKLKLPKISEGNYQYTIQGVYSINALGGNGKKFKEISINRYLNLLKLPNKKNEEYFWITNDYLYINNPVLKAVKLVAFFDKDVSNDIMFPECGCGGQLPIVEDVCKNPLDKEFALPGYLEKAVLELTSKTLLSTYFRLKIDISQDNIDGQSPNTKQSS